MKLLIITPACHFKSVGAVQKDIYSMIELLLEMGHEASLYTLDQPGQDAAILDFVRGTYKIEVRKFGPAGGLFAWFRAAIFDWALFDRSAYPFFELARAKEFNDFVVNFNPDMVLSFCSYSWPVAREFKKLGIRTIIRSHNFEPLQFWEELELSGKLNPYNWLRLFVKWLGERRTALVPDALAVISPKELAEYKRIRVDGIFLLPLVSLTKLIGEPRIVVEKFPLHLFYMGASYNVPFHLRGAWMLIEGIAPKVEMLASGKFIFHLCGAKLPESLVKKCIDNIVYEGFVPETQLEEFFNKMDAGVFPVFSGRGMKQKIFEAIARAFPVVAPRVSLGGYGLTDKKDILIADNEDQFVSATISLQNPLLRELLSKNAYNFARDQFNREKLVNIIEGYIIYGKNGGQKD